MVSKVLGIFSDIIALLLLWIKVENLSLWLRIALSFICLALSAIIIYCEKGRYEAKVSDFLAEDGKVKHIFIHKNANFKANMLVSVYYCRHGQSHLSAIGYVVDNNDGSLQVIIIKVFGDSILQINETNKSYKDFVVTPSMKYSETESLFSTTTQQQGGI